MVQAAVPAHLAALSYTAAGMPGVATAGRARGGSFHHGYGAPLRAPSADTASQQTYYAAEAGGAGDPQRFSYDTTTISSADKRLLFAQGRPMAKDSSGSGSAWATGTLSDKQTPTQSTVESRLFFSGTVTATDMSRATDKREKDRMGVFGTSNSYAGSYGRVTSESIGRDLNPLGRGNGRQYIAGAIQLGRAAPPVPLSGGSGTGNSINNDLQKGLGASDSGCSHVSDYPCLDAFFARREQAGNPDCGTAWAVNQAVFACPCCPEACTPEEFAADPEGCFCILCKCQAEGCKCAKCKDPVGLEGLCCPHCGCCPPGDGSKPGKIPGMTPAQRKLNFQYFKDPRNRQAWLETAYKALESLCADYFWECTGKYNPNHACFTINSWAVLRNVCGAVRSQIALSLIYDESRYKAGFGDCDNAKYGFSHGTKRCSANNTIWLCAANMRWGTDKDATILKSVLLHELMHVSDCGAGRLDYGSMGVTCCDLTSGGTGVVSDNRADAYADICSMGVARDWYMGGQYEVSYDQRCGDWCCRCSLCGNLLVGDWPYE